MLGREAAVGGGLATAVLGVFLHFVVAFCVATVYYLVSRNVPFLLRHPIVSGIVYGVGVNYVMQYVVIPRSAIGSHAGGSESFVSLLNSLFGHALLVGLPVGLIASWSANRT